MTVALVIFYLIGWLAAWVIALRWFIRDMPGHLRGAALGMGNLFGFFIGMVWPLVAIASIPTAIAKHLDAKDTP